MKPEAGIRTSRCIMDEPAAKVVQTGEPLIPASPPFVALGPSIVEAHRLAALGASGSESSPRSQLNQRLSSDPVSESVNNREQFAADAIDGRS